MDSEFLTVDVRILLVANMDINVKKITLNTILLCLTSKMKNIKIITVNTAVSILTIAKLLEASAHSIDPK